MNAATRCIPKRTNWRDLYRAAISETDKNMIALRLSEAEEAVLARAREVFYGGFDLEEWAALEEALGALDAIKNTLPHTEAA
jgi:hypothetical protein